MSDSTAPTRPDVALVLRTYAGSDGDATKRLYAELERLGPIGHVAVNLFRACKASERAKVYRGGGYRAAAYEKKDWSLGKLCDALAFCKHDLGWGWGTDARLKERGDPHHHVLYIDLPTGQASFHTGQRQGGPDYPGQWDGVPGQSADRICRWIGRLFE